MAHLRVTSLSCFFIFLLEEGVKNGPREGAFHVFHFFFFHFFHVCFFLKKNFFFFFFLVFLPKIFIAGKSIRV